MTLRLLLLCFLSSLALAHEGVELGPHGGRILEFSPDETLHGEILVQGSQFHVRLLDKDLKPITLPQSTLRVTTGDRRAPQKLAVTSDPTGFLVPLVKAGEWLIFQFKPTPDAKTITARLEYNTANCEGCQHPEWLCQCKPESK